MLKKSTAVFMIVAALLCGSLLTLGVTGYMQVVGQAAGEGVAAVLQTGSGLQDKESQKLGTALNLIEDNYYDKVDRDKLIDGAVNGMMEALGDPYSNYMGKETAEKFEESIEGSFSGIGAEVSSDNGKVVVVSPIKGAPAEKAGIQAKDIILSVNGETLEGLELNDAVAKIRGPKGSKATLKVQRTGSAEPLEFVITRDDVKLETVYATMEKDGVGVIEVTQFSMNTAERFKEELDNLEKQGMKGLVIDVRNDPGGVLQRVIEMAEQFVPAGKTIVQVENKDKSREVSTSKGSSKDYPVVVLMNKGSASASEILAGALQQSAGAKLIGEHSFGKGTVQTSFEKELGDGSLLKITIAKWLTPNGTWIHGKGIEPDIAVAQPDYFSVAPINKSVTLQYNMNSSDVKSAQTMLDGLGYKPGRKDGYFDAGTKEAVKKFQSASKLQATGAIDAKTAEALEQALIKVIQDPANDNQRNRGIEEVRKEIQKAASNK
ncbi:MULTISPECIES: S41 family peptidase [unclassified Paenibacillus]|uniref:S41 family peptidase n=1 Tax=unclassified Paenibacillus TaxID=185978 RepID=UPI0024056043|nr:MULTISPECIES: S41 family peptidase [unclassified Paenibacillus]MDF9840179.1 carboxyl-terminal processing protease [Paenibacillus sp. PastF-2]MDF9846761.1 carboxyl-terminal processing protease [Paenibacillus sp. PastM-2]MDF9852890.1 carboxyl-terminal processing protease [Paenibacillus sp. PastF-1]MDH6478605.1 carboxyl-terminal processing protease [Paenibacillus sp. PastH-2]MDH6505897.1 carboxyl-terminal processing protease [Paenibacillus sp. PastM-3]